MRFSRKLIPVIIFFFIIINVVWHLNSLKMKPALTQMVGEIDDMLLSW